MLKIHVCFNYLYKCDIFTKQDANVHETSVVLVLQIAKQGKKKMRVLYRMK